MGGVGWGTLEATSGTRGLARRELNGRVMDMVCWKGVL